MKFFLSLSLGLLIPHFIIAQNNTTAYEFIGALRTSNDEIISYKINFQEIENGKIEGESITDFYGENKTKSKITGVINFKEKKLSFREVENIKTISKESQTIFCYVYVKDLKIRTFKQKRIIQGEFNGSFKSGEHCASGSIYLAETKLLVDLNISNDSIRKLDSLMKVAVAMKEVKFLQNNDKVNFTSHENNIVFDVFDGSKEDGDMINIYYNDKLIEENLIIKNEKKKIIIPFNEKKGIVKVVALNEGKNGSNTANFIVFHSKKSTPIMSNLKKNELVILEFNQ